MNSGVVAVELVGAVPPTSLGDEGGGGDVALLACVCSSSLAAAAEDESRRRELPLALLSWRTHRRHVLNCRAGGMRDAMAQRRAGVGGTLVDWWSGSGGGVLEVVQGCGHRGRSLVSKMW